MAKIVRIVVINSEEEAIVFDNALERAGITVTTLDTEGNNQQFTNLQQTVSLTEQRFKEQKDKLLRILAHELKTPLNIILGYSQLLLSENFGRLNLQQQIMTKNILSSGEDLINLTKRIFNLFQVKTGYITIQSEGFNLKNLVAEIISEIRPQAEKKQLKLELNYNINNFFCIGDSDKLKQIVINLIDNGIKFTNYGSVKITLSEDAENFLIITVEDTGIGISEQDLCHIFEEFWQVDQSLQRPYQGLGLGLSLVKTLVETMGGKITVESQIGVGSTFCVMIPRYLFGDRKKFPQNHEQANKVTNS